MPKYAEWRDQKKLVFIIPAFIYALIAVAAFVAEAFGSCSRGGGIYLILGFGSIPFLAAVAFLFGPMLHVVLRVVISLLTVGCGLFVWGVAA